MGQSARHRHRPDRRRRVGYRRRQGRLGHGRHGTHCNQGGASGSTGIWMGAKPLRSASPKRAGLLVQRPRRSWACPRTSCASTTRGEPVSDPSKKASYSELIGGPLLQSPGRMEQADRQPMDIKSSEGEVASEYRVVGSPSRAATCPEGVPHEKYVTDVSLRRCCTRA